MGSKWRNYFDTDIFQENYMAFVKVDNSVCDNVVISRLVPRLDDKIGNIDKGNIVLVKQIVNDENCLYINNGDSFRLLSGAINTAMYHKNCVHLNWHRALKLTDNLGIQPKFPNNHHYKDSTGGQYSPIIDIIDMVNIYIFVLKKSSTHANESVYSRSFHNRRSLDCSTCTAGTCMRILHVPVHVLKSLRFLADLFRQRVRVLVTYTLRVRKKVPSP